MIDGNDFTERIPSEIGVLQNLEFLILANNAFTGSVPPELGMLENLEVFELDKNRLSGTMPSELGMLQALGKVVLGLQGQSLCLNTTIWCTLSFLTILFRSCL